MKIGDGINVEDGVISVPLKEGLVGVGQVMITFDSTHPATTYLGTTWIKIEDRFLLGTTGPEVSGTIGGNETVTLTSDNNAPHFHTATQSSHMHTQAQHNHRQGNQQRGGGMHFGSSGTTWVETYEHHKGYNNQPVPLTSSNGGDNTGVATPVITVNTSGKGTPFSILPPFMKVHIWRRMS